MNLSIKAETSMGKSTLAMTAPKKVVVLNSDMGADGALNGFMFDSLFKRFKCQTIDYRGATEDSWKDFDITIVEFPAPLTLRSEVLVGKKEMWDSFLRLFVDACEDKEVRTIVLDTATIWRRHRADAHLQALQEKNKADGEKPRQQLQQIEYGRPNDDIRALYTYTQSIKKNLVAIHHLTDEYINDKATGNRIMEGLNNTYNFMDWAVQMDKKKGAIVAKITKCRNNSNMEGTEIPSPTWNKLVDMVSMSLGGRVQFEKEV